MGTPYFLHFSELLKKFFFAYTCIYRQVDLQKVQFLNVDLEYIFRF